MHAKSAGDVVVVFTVVTVDDEDTIQGPFLLLDLWQWPLCPVDIVFCAKIERLIEAGRAQGASTKVESASAKVWRIHGGRWLVLMLLCCHVVFEIEFVNLTSTLTRFM